MEARKETRRKKILSVKFFADEYRNLQQVARLEGLTMAENKMAQVAALFGKKLGEEFTVQDFSGYRYDMKFTINGFYVVPTDFHDDTPDWGWDNDLLEHMLTGKAVIVDD